MKTVAQLVDELIRSNLKSNGREVSYTEIAQSLNGMIDPSHISKLRYGQIKNPSRDTLLALCQYFKVSACYFFPELEEVEKTRECADTEAETDPIIVALRSTTISSDVRLKLVQLIQALQQNQSRD